MGANKRRKRRGLGFYPWLVIVVLVMTGLIFWSLILFWQYLEAYEASRHEHTIRHFSDNIDHAYWEGRARDEIASRLTEFEGDPDAALGPHLPKIHGVPYALRQKSDESTPEAPVYYVRAGARDIGVVRLAPAGEAGYGFHLWEVGSVEFIGSFVDGFAGSVGVTASQNALVFVNGVRVPDAYRVECVLDYGASYLIPGIFGDAEVSVVEFDGSGPGPYYAENGEFLFHIVEPFSRAFVVTVPEGSAVYVDGEAVGTDKIAESGIVPEIFIGAVGPADVPLTLQRYEFELAGLYSEPAVSAAYAAAPGGLGVPLVPDMPGDGGIVFRLPFSAELEELHAGAAEAFIRSFVRFGANAGNDIDANFADVGGKMLRGSDLLRRTRSAVDTMRWVSNASVHYNSLEIANFRPYGEDYFTCEIRYNITTRTYYETHDVEGNYEVLFARSGGRWLAANMAALG